MHLRQQAAPFGFFCARTFTAALVVALLLATLCSGQAAGPEPKRVMLLHSFGPRFKPWSDYAEFIRAEIGRLSPTPVDFVDQSLVAARAGDVQSEAPFSDYLAALYAQHPPDLIIAIGAPAAAFVQHHRQRLFPKVSMVVTAVDQRRVRYEDLTENDTVVPVANDIPVLFDNILHVLPLTKTIAIVNGDSPIERYWTAELRRELAPLMSRVEFKWYDGLSFEEVLKETAHLPPHSAIFSVLMNVDVAGIVRESGIALKKLASTANAPIFSYDDSYFQGAIVGGPMFSVLEGSQITAAVAMRILDGEKPANIKTPPVKYASPRFDWRQMQRWGIAESSLPAGSTVYFREPTVWARYSWPIGLIIAVILLQAALISALLHQHRRRQLAEVQARQRMAELAHVNRFSTAGVLTASIAHEINQPLGSILTNAETVQVILKSPKPDIVELNEIIDDIVRDDRRAGEVIRRMKSLLTKAPFELKGLDLNDVAREAGDFLSTLAVARKVELTSLITQNTLPILGDRIQLQQVVLNLVVNGIDAMKDAPAENRTIRIRTSRAGKFAQISVSDRGPGIPEQQLNEIFEPFFTSKAEGMGMGLSIARSIIEAHHGLIWAKNRDHGGASFWIKLPLSMEGLEKKMARTTGTV